MATTARKGTGAGHRGRGSREGRPSRARRTAAAGRTRRWSHKVTSVSTYPRAGLFTKDARTIAREMGSHKVSPKGVGSGIRMIQFFINRAGKSLPASRRRELERAKKILQRRLG